MGTPAQILPKTLPSTPSRVRKPASLAAADPAAAAAVFSAWRTLAGQLLPCRRSRPPVRVVRPRRRRGRGRGSRYSLRADCSIEELQQPSQVQLGGDRRRDPGPGYWFQCQERRVGRGTAILLKRHRRTFAPGCATACDVSIARPAPSGPCHVTGWARRGVPRLAKALGLSPGQVMLSMPDPMGGGPKPN